jgi:hypothetical protein
MSSVTRPRARRTPFIPPTPTSKGAGAIDRGTGPDRGNPAGDTAGGGGGGGEAGGLDADPARLPLTLPPDDPADDQDDDDTPEWAPEDRAALGPDPARAPGLPLIDYVRGEASWYRHQGGSGAALIAAAIEALAAELAITEAADPEQHQDRMDALIDARECFAGAR